MCIAILKPKDVIIPEAHLHESFLSNPDGAGFMYAENDKLYVEKGFMTFDSFMEAYKPHKEKVAALHFRIATHGNTDEENTHPFIVGKNLAVIHNGIISKVDRKKDLSKSDTYHFNEKFLTQFYKRDGRFAYKDHFKDLIKEYIGWSKLVFLNNKGHYSIINEMAGHWENNVWYSNNSYKKVLPMKMPVISPSKKSTTPAQTYKIGTRVTCSRSESGRKWSGFGTIQYFTGGLKVGVLMEDTLKVEEFHMTYVDFAPEQEALPFGESDDFEVGDLVVRSDSHQSNEIGEVQGTAGRTHVAVKWLGDDGMPSGPDHIISRHKLSHWFDI